MVLCVSSIFRKIKREFHFFLLMIELLRWLGTEMVNSRIFFYVLHVKVSYQRLCYFGEKTCQN